MPRHLPVQQSGNGNTCLMHVQEKLGFTAEEVAPFEIAAPAAAALPSRTLPAYNGYGSYEDSAQNCISLLPQQPK